MARETARLATTQRDDARMRAAGHEARQERARQAVRCWRFLARTCLIALDAWYSYKRIFSHVSL